MKKFLIIQTAFIGDVVLATGISEKLHQTFPDAQIDFLLRKGNEGLVKDHPFLHNVWVWDKKNQKNKNLLRIIGHVRKEKYDYVINVHRFATSGLITWLSGAKNKIGFDKNPFSFCYTHKVKHVLSEPYTSNPLHETDRNHLLIRDITDDQKALPKLYPSAKDYNSVKAYKNQPYVCIAPSSVWFTKQFPAEKWTELIDEIPERFSVYLLGAPGDEAIAKTVIHASTNKRVVSLCGKLNFLESAALMQHATMNYANDSAPMHFASAVNAPVTAVYCSTVPAFGFGPLSDYNNVVEVPERLSCRPCGLHGHSACPEGHFNCAKKITNSQLLWWTSKTT
ncbi:MAG TPA: glycosyltransferase family 9 protein [Flavipsychrobacter sp.]|nr:glycosyltransferase family 9 protein [Flavipsychrobacter sp.]